MSTHPSFCNYDGVLYPHSTVGLQEDAAMNYFPRSGGAPGGVGNLHAPVARRPLQAVQTSLHPTAMDHLPQTAASPLLDKLVQRHGANLYGPMAGAGPSTSVYPHLQRSQGELRLHTYNHAPSQMSEAEQFDGFQSHQMQHKLYSRAHEASYQQANQMQPAYHFQAQGFNEYSAKSLYPEPDRNSYASFAPLCTSTPFDMYEQSTQSRAGAESGNQFRPQSAPQPQPQQPRPFPQSLQPPSTSHQWPAHTAPAPAPACAPTSSPSPFRKPLEPADSRQNARPLFSNSSGAVHPMHAPVQQASSPGPAPLCAPFQPTPPPSPAAKSPAVSPAPRSRTSSTGSMMDTDESAVRSSKVPHVVDKGMILLTGTVDQVLRWGRQLSDIVRPDVLFEIFGTLESVVLSSYPQGILLVLRALEGGAQLQGIFWEIDRVLVAPPLKSAVRCVSRLGPRPSSFTTRQVPRLQVLNLRPVNRSQLPCLTRIAFQCQRAVQQGVLDAPKTASSAGSARGSAARTTPATPTRTRQTLISSYGTPDRRGAAVDQTV